MKKGVLPRVAKGCLVWHRLLFYPGGPYQLFIYRTVGGNRGKRSGFNYVVKLDDQGFACKGNPPSQRERGGDYLLEISQPYKEKREKNHEGPLYLNETLR